jgi:hypothetical protein
MRCARFATIGLLLLGAAAAHAAEPGETGPLRGPLAPAWREATAMATRSLGEEHATRITLLGYAAAVGRACEGLALNGARYKGAFRELAEERQDEMTSDEKARSQMRRVAYHLGVATGIFLSEHALDAERFCAGARESIAADPEIATFFTTEAAPTTGEAR